MKGIEMYPTRVTTVSFLLTISILMGTAGARQAPDPIDFGRLLHEMYDLSGLARWPDSEYTTVQYSSYDRHSVSPDAEGWYNNSDGFGRETIPAFQAVLQEPNEGGIGLYLIADVKGPGAVVRGWSAGMDGELKAYLDGSDTPFFEGSGYDFMARKSVSLLKGANSQSGYEDAFCQQDADYMPIPFAKSFRVTWQGNIQRLHFYHLEIRHPLSPRQQRIQSC